MLATKRGFWRFGSSQIISTSANHFLGELLAPDRPILYRFLVSLDNQPVLQHSVQEQVLGKGYTWYRQPPVLIAYDAGCRTLCVHNQRRNLSGRGWQCWWLAGRELGGPGRDIGRSGGLNQPSLSGHRVRWKWPFLAGRSAGHQPTIGASGRSPP